MLNFTKLKVTFVYLVLFVLVFFASLNLKNNNLLDKQVNLGLDLQGGSYILLEIDTNPLISQRIQNKVIPIKKLLNENEIKYEDFNVKENEITFLIDEAKKNTFKNLFLKQTDNQVNNFIRFFNGSAKGFSFSRGSV